jgi:alkyl hydroperoxide reductase subunit F
MSPEEVGVILPQEETLVESPPIESGREYDLIIVGAGPAGLTAGVYAARKMLNTLLISEDVGGQLLLTSEVENYLGFYYIEGVALVEKFEEQVRRHPIDVDLGEKVSKVEHEPPKFRVVTESGKFFKSETVIIATGKRSKKLNVPGEQELVGRGVSYCATCDAPLFAGKDVAVIGGGNSALTAVNDLLNIGATRIHVVNIVDRLQADPILIEKTENPEKVELHLGHEVVEIGGMGSRVASITIRHSDSGQTKILEVEGVFIEIGLVPNSELARGLVRMNQWGEIITDCYARTSTEGVFAAGDVTTVPEKQIIVAAGDGCKAALAAYAYLLHR